VRPIRIGCSGWNYQHWRNGVFYPPRLPPRRWLEFYSRHFDTVEVNATFYRLPKEQAVASWVRESPPDFLFAVKMSRYVTHVKRLRDLPPSLELFYTRIRPLAESPKLGPVLWQLPGTFRRDDERLAEALAQLPAGRHCFEFRHESWFVEKVYELLHSHGAALVIGDTPTRPFQTHELTADWTFIRFHHGTRGRGSNYSERELEDWASRIERWARRVDVYAYFNNDRNGYAVRNGLWLKKRLGV
jgi:uncharacterized protein YecE (DUF72 family)